MTKFEQFFGFELKEASESKAEVFGVSSKRYKEICRAFIITLRKDNTTNPPLNQLIEIAVEHTNTISEAMVITLFVMDTYKQLSDILLLSKMVTHLGGEVGAA